MSRSPVRPRDLHRNAPRPVPLVISSAFHVLLAAALLWTWNLPDVNRQQKKLPDEQKETPRETKIIWYHLQKLPEVSSEQGPDTNRRPDAVQPSKTVMISQPKVVAPAPQIIRQPEDPLPLLRVPVPNLIAVKRGSPALPDLPEQPLPLFARRPNVPIALDLKKPEPKEFVPPQLQSTAKKPPTTPTMVAVPEPSVIAPGGSGGSNDVNALVLSLLPGRGVPPPGHSDASAGPAGNGPPGQSQGQGIKIAGVTVRPEPPKEVKPEPESKPYIATSVAPLENTLSAPLPASSRTIPRSIESRFHGRVVYAVVVPMRKVPGYAEDWTIWFTPHQAGEGVTSAAQMRPPLPIRRFFVRNGEVPFPQGRVQIFALIDKLGRIDSITVGGSSGAASDAVIADLKSWEFVPALRNREAVDVDVIVELSYNSRSVGTGTMGTSER
ncbi:MAG TPA: energy transducer TonB [Bryobacteraceae bacterium]|nr:energy transducer TonB [Bryobacteraceae bacterium]